MVKGQNRSHNQSIYQVRETPAATMHAAINWFFSIAMHKGPEKTVLCLTYITILHSRAVASNMPTEALASVISFVFVVYSHRKHT